MEALTILLLADAQTDYEELVALSVAQIVMQEAHNLKGMNGGLYSTQGSYDRKKLKDFFNLLMYEFSDRWFRALIDAPLIPAGFRSFLRNPVESGGIKFGRDTSQNDILGDEYSCGMM